MFWSHSYVVDRVQFHLDYTLCVFKTSISFFFFSLDTEISNIGKLYSSMKLKGEKLKKRSEVQARA